MKKLTIIFLTIALLAAFITGCTKDNGDIIANDSNVAENSTDNTTDNDDDIPDKETEGNNANAIGEDDNGMEKPEINEGDSNDNTSKSDITVDTVMNAIRAAYGDNYLPNVDIFPELLETEFGLTSDMYEAIKAEQPMISAHADRVVVVKAKEGRTDDVEAALVAAKDRKINDTLQYPMNLPKINATKVVRNGDFVCFLLVGAINNIENATEEEVKQFAEEEVGKGVQAFNDLFK